MRILTTALVLALVAGSASASGVTGKYVEARTCDIWTGPCFSNSDMNFTGKNAVLAWQIDTGTFDKVKLDGLTVVAVVAASDTLGLSQTGEGKAVLLVDKRATDEQKAALIKLAKKQGGKLLSNVVKVEAIKIEMDFCPCKEGGCAILDAGFAKIETRCLDHKHDKLCGNESAFYPPLVPGVKATPAVTVKHSYTGKDAGTTWSDPGRRGAYLGTFELR